MPRVDQSVMLCVACASSISALDGMQPTFTHTPPNPASPLLSTKTTLRPNWAAAIAATYPPGPPPMTNKSTDDGISPTTTNTYLFSRSESGRNNNSAISETNAPKCAPSFTR